MACTYRVSAYLSVMADESFLLAAEHTSGGTGHAERR
jgi:hypothetical protein